MIGVKTMATTAKKTKRDKGKTSKAKGAAKSKRAYTQAPRAVDPGIPCVHCGHKYDHTVTNTYPNGNRRRKCGGCGKPFLTQRATEDGLLKSGN